MRYECVYIIPRSILKIVNIPSHLSNTRYENSVVVTTGSSAKHPSNPASFASQKPRKFHSCLESHAVESCTTRTCVRGRVIRKFHDKPA